MAKVNKICITCNKSFKVENKELNRGNGKYCSISCGSKQPKLLQFNSICKHCGKTYLSASQQSKFCSSSCKQKNYRLKSKGESSIKSFYKVFKDTPCEICGWKEASRDLHHITPVSQNGENKVENLISVCPNHHRMIHTNLISKNTLLKCIAYRTISSS